MAINLTGHIMEDSMKNKNLVLELILSISLVGCAQPHQENTKKTVNTESKNYIRGGSFNTIAFEDGKKTLACIKYSAAISKGIFLNFDDAVKPIIRNATVTANSEQLKLCREYFNSEEYTHTSLFIEPFEYTINGFVFKRGDINLINEGGNKAGIDVNSDNKADYVHTCSSMEAEHLNIWSDKSKNKRLAYANRYIDADLIETCNNNDYPEEE